MPRVRRRRPFRQLDQFDRGRIIALREAGYSYREIGQVLNRNAATVMRVWRQWRRTGVRERARGTGAQRRTTDQQDRRLRQLALRDRFATTREIAMQFFNEYGRVSSMRTVYRRIRQFGLQSYRPHLVLPLSPIHRQQRLRWSIERQNWDQEWNLIVFSDESRFCLGMHDGRRRVRRLRGERRQIQFSVERHVHNTVGVMAWGAIAYGSRSPLVFIRGNMSSARYIQEILEPVLVPYVRGLPNALFQQDNARPHIAQVTRDFLDVFDVQVLPWPPRSPDLSPIEHVWDMIGRRLLNLHPLPQSLEDLQHAVRVAWDEIPQGGIDNLIRSMPRRVNECIRNRGASTHY